MNRRLLIISPYFPPSNAADAQRVRMSLPYFRKFGWDADVVTVDPVHSEMTKDEILMRLLPGGLMIDKVGAFSKKWTGVFGLGSLALRSMWFYYWRVNTLLKARKYDLIFFSTTQFPLTILGAVWKKRYGVPYVIDMQDPWHSNYYQDKPKTQRPPKYWFSYRLNKYLEPFAMRSADGLISVSPAYIADLRERYPELYSKPAETITFGAFQPDLALAAELGSQFEPLLDPSSKNLVYVGRGGLDMQKAIRTFFTALRRGIDREPEVFSRLKIYFIGTSYAPSGHGTPTILPLAEEYGIAGQVVEITDRISYYHTLSTLQHADALFVPGSDDPKYTASKIYPYLLAGKPILALFNPESPAIPVLREYGARYVFDYNGTDELYDRIVEFLQTIIISGPTRVEYNQAALKKYSAETMTQKQAELFDVVIGRTETNNKGKK